MERVEQIALHLAKLTHAAGAETAQTRELIPPNLDVVTSDLDIEALTRSLLDISRELDLYLQGLLSIEVPPAARLRREIARLQTELEVKDGLIAKNVAMLRETQEKWREEMENQRKKIYPS